jgi:4-carboxymuconolactone decarboxylase
MTNTTPAKTRCTHLRASALAVALGLVTVLGCTANEKEIEPMTQSQTTPANSSVTLNARQQAIVPIAAFAAAGDITKLNMALNQGLDGGLTVSDAKEVLIQLYAYAGFPRSLNALSELMKVLEARKQRGIKDAPGNAPSHPIAKGDALMAAGTANQIKLSGGPVAGPLFQFAPTANEFLRSHLFGDIFERDNLDWQSRELATVGMLSALPGAEPQLLAHMRISMNVGLTESQLRQLTHILANRVDTEMARRAREALAQQLASNTGKKQ